MVLAIWPAYVPPSMPKSVDAPAYTTPYLALMQEAIEHFGLSEDRQEKKDSLFEWFVTQEVDGEPVSKNLADAMATLIRLPCSQRGGAKREDGPDLRRAADAGGSAPRRRPSSAARLDAGGSSRVPPDASGFLRAPFRPGPRTDSNGCLALGSPRHARRREARAGTAVIVRVVTHTSPSARTRDPGTGGNR